MKTVSQGEQVVDPDQQITRKAVYALKNKDKKIDNGNQKFVFSPPEHLKEQTKRLLKQIQSNQWSKQMQIKGYKGSFKIENWITIETLLRDVRGLQSIGFVDTQLDKQHLTVLSKWLMRIVPQKLTIKFSQNELDNDDFQDFLYFLFDKNIDIDSIFITGNPGIYKGPLIQELKSYLNNKYANNLYQLIEDKEALSIAIVKLSQQLTNPERDQVISAASKKINKTQYYKLTLKNCFTQENWKGFQDLIMTTYRKENVEQLSFLDISDNFLGTQSAFNKMCESISSAKGLIALKIQNQPLLNNSTTVQFLMGNRYDSLKLNELDISNNKEILEKTFKLLSDNIFKKCRIIHLGQSLPQQLSTLYKLFVMTEAFAEQTQQLRKLLNEQKIYKKDNLEILDLSLVENYNRHDLVEKVLLSTVFTEFSSIEKLHVQNLDVGRCQAYTKTIRTFKEQIENLKIENLLFANYKHSLKHIVFPKQTYRMEVETMKEFFLEYLFTQKGNPIEIETFDIESHTFRQVNRAEGLQQACETVLAKTEEDQEVQYTIKKLSIIDGDYEMNMNSLKCFLYTSSVKLTELSYQHDQITGEWAEIVNISSQYLNSLAPNEFHSLKVLKLADLTEVTFEIHEFLDTFVFHQKMQLEELEFRQVTTIRIEANRDKLITRIRQIKEIMPLKKLCFGGFEGIGEEDFLEFLVFNKVIKLESLTLNAVSLSTYLPTIKQIIGKAHYRNNLDNLQYLEFNNLKAMVEKNDWQSIIDIFLIRQRSSIKSFTIISLKLDENFAEPLKTLLQPFIEEVKVKYTNADNNNALPQQESEPIKLPFVLEKLKIEKCELKEDFLSGFLVVTQLSHLSLIENGDLQNSITRCVDQIKAEKLNQYYSFKITNFNCQGSFFENQDTFSKLVCGIILNKDRQFLESLNLDNCSISGGMLDLLTDQLLKIKELQKNCKRIFSLREINLSNNKLIPVQSWNKLWYVLLNENQYENQEQQNQHEIEQQKELEEKKEQLIKETSQIITSKHLNLKQKVLNHYDKFTPSFPKQLQHLNLRMDFTFLNEAEQKHEYYRMLVGYIVHPESQLKDLELDSLNLIIFIQACQEAYDFSKVYQQQSLQQPSQTHKSLIKSIKLTNLKESDEKSSEKFLEFFLCSNHIELNKFTISGSKQPIIKHLLNNINRRDTYELEELHLLESEETLSQDLAEQFAKMIIFGQKMQVKILSCSPKIEQINPEIIQEMDSTKNKITQFKIKYDSDSQETNTFYASVLQKLAVSHLTELEIEAKDASSIFTSLLEKVPQDAINLEKLSINGEVTLNKPQFQYVEQMLGKLKLIKVKTLGLQNDEEIYEMCQQLPFQEQRKCKLDIEKLKCNNVQDCTKKLLFNPNVGLTELTIRSSELFQNVQIHDLRQNLRYLNLSMGLLYNSNIQLSEQSLKTVGELLIYNEESRLEDLILHQCHLKEPGVAALVKGAVQFRENVEIEGRQKTAQLTLKRLSIYYSLYIGNAGADLLAKYILYFQYINIERIEVLVTNWNDAMTLSLCEGAQNWLQFQQRHNRQYQTYYPLRYLDIGRNEFVERKETWQELLKTFVFTEKGKLLETFNIHFMALNDLRTGYLVDEALQFFDKQPADYVFQVKKMNFSQNNSLTHIGWQNLCKNFLFHPKVHLEELNMISTMLDSKIKLEVIAEVIKERALQSPNKKIPLHTFLCYNISLKDSICEYLSEQPPNYQPPEDLPVEVEYKDSRNVGNFDGVPESYGEILQIFQRTLEQRNSLVYKKDWKLTRYRYSYYHLNICDHYLKILNQYYKDQGKGQITINFNLQTLDLMAFYFRYIIDFPGDPYPYNLLFQKQCFDYFKERDCQIFTIKIIQAEFSELEQINQLQILRIWENIKNNKNQKTSIEQIQVEYYLNDDLIEEMFNQGYDEGDIISLIRTIPPSKIRIQNSLSIQAIKAIYSIMSETYYFQQSIISYSFDNPLNIGIGYKLRELSYNYQTEGIWQKFLKNFLYRFFNLFVAPTKKYIYNEEVKKVGKLIAKNEGYYYTTVFIHFIFIFQMIFIFYYYIFTQETQKLPSLQEKLSYSYDQVHSVCVTYIVFQTLIESQLFLKIAINVPSQFIKKQKLLIYLDCLWAIILSQIHKLQLLNQMILIVNSYYCDQFIIFILALIACLAPQIAYLLRNINLILKRLANKQKNKKVSLQQLSISINQLFTICFLVKNRALSSLLDTLAPFNAMIIPNISWNRRIFKQNAGRSINNHVIYYFYSLLFEDLPQLFLQICFVFSQNGEIQQSCIIYASLATAIYITLYSFYKFLSIRSSLLLQSDFDKLQQRQQRSYKAILYNNLAEEQNQIDLFTKLFNANEQKIEQKDQIPEEQQHLLE